MNYIQIQWWLSPKRIIPVSYLWGFAEGLFFFIVPDIAIAFVALFNQKKSIIALFFSILGSLTAGFMIYGLYSVAGDNLLKWVTFVPGVTDKMVVEMAKNLHSQLPALEQVALAGVPYKVYAIVSAHSHISLFIFLLWTVGARSVRLLPAVLVAGAIGFLARKSIKKYTKKWLGVFGTVWVVIYIVYAVSVWWRY